MGATAEERDVNWGSVENFFAMGGYGYYVWGSYAMAVFCIALEFLSLKMKTKK
jgi:heme exporter protein D